MTNNEKFKKWMDSIPYGEYLTIRKKVIKECKINSSTYGNWRNGSCTIPLLAQEKINELAKRDIFNEEEATPVETQPRD